MNAISTSDEWDAYNRGYYEIEKKEQLFRTARIAQKPTVFTEYEVGDVVAVKWVREWPEGNHQYEIDGRGAACVMGSHLLKDFVL